MGVVEHADGLGESEKVLPVEPFKTGEIARHVGDAALIHGRQAGRGHADGGGLSVFLQQSSDALFYGLFPIIAAGWRDGARDFLAIRGQAERLEAGAAEVEA